jgi:hypothetical protein
MTKVFFFLFFFFNKCLKKIKSTPKEYHIFIEGRGLSTRTAPLAISNEGNPTQHRLQTKQPQHKAPVLSKEPSHVSTDARHLRRWTTPERPSLSTHHPKEINDGTWSDPRRCPQEHASKDVHSDGMSRCRGVQRSTVGARKPPSSTRRTTKRGASMPLFKITPIATAISRATKDYRGLRLYRRFEKKNSILQHHITIYSTYINNSQMHRKVT